METWAKASSWNQVLLYLLLSPVSPYAVVLTGGYSETIENDKFVAVTKQQYTTTI